MIVWSKLAIQYKNNMIMKFHFNQMNEYNEL